MTRDPKTLSVGMVGLGMIFDETYRPCFERLYRDGLRHRLYDTVSVQLAGVATRTGRRAEAYLRQAAPERINPCGSHAGDLALQGLLEQNPHCVCIATPDDRHFEAARDALRAGCHVLIEKPSVLSLQQLDELLDLAHSQDLLARVVYHKLFDPDHKKLRTLVRTNALSHVNNGYCSLLEPKLISGAQFSEWISGRNPGTYVAVHYIKLIDFTFGGRLKTVTATGQRGLVGPADGDTWDSCQLRLVYEYSDGREAAFDIHTSWVTPDNFPGYVEQEVQFRFDNGVWNAHSRKRGVECTIEGKTPLEMKISLNNHYNGSFVEPWDEPAQRGYGIEAIERFLHEVAYLEFAGPDETRKDRLSQLRELSFSDLAADRQVVAAVQALEAILARQAAGRPDCVVRVDPNDGTLTLSEPGGVSEVIYSGTS